MHYSIVNILDEHKNKLFLKASKNKAKISSWPKEEGGKENEEKKRKRKKKEKKKKSCWV